MHSSLCINTYAGYVTYVLLSYVRITTNRKGYTMIWYILTFIGGAVAGVAGLLFILPRIEYLWQYVDKKIRQIRRLPW